LPLIKYYLGDQIKKNEMGREYGRHRERRDADIVLVGRSEGKRPSGRRRPRWEDKIKMDLHEKGWGGVDCIKLN
jgi:hypothetical protein